MKKLFLLTLLATTLLQCSCSQEKKNIEAVRLANIRDFEYEYSLAKTNILNYKSLMWREKRSNALEKLRSFNLKNFKEAIICDASLVYSYPEEGAYCLLIDRLDPFYRIYDIEMKNGEKTFLAKKRKHEFWGTETDCFEAGKSKLKRYHKEHEVVGIVFTYTYYWEPEDSEYNAFKELNKQDWKVRFLKSGVPVTEWHPVTFYDFESKEYQEVFEKFRESVSKSQEQQR